MTDEGWFDEWIDEQLDRIATDLGLSEDTPPELLTRELGFRFGSKLKDLLPVGQEVYDQVLRSALGSLSEVFPISIDDDTRAFQAVLFAPMVSVALTGRGLSVPELSEVAGLSPSQLYRVMRKGLGLFFKPADPEPRTGIHRAQSGVDHRKARLTLDHDNFLAKEWPEPLDDFQPFLLGIIDGARASLEDPWVRTQVEVGFKSAIAKVLRDPSLGEIFDGGILAAQRILQGMTDAGLLLTTAERDRAHAAGKVLMELSGQKKDFLAALSSAAAEIEARSTGTRPAQLTAGIPVR